ncbi:hypothetical protein IQ06DRAFT_22029 [Phaeosphaeriaceae sp. SRC1lsM3a]|nr:hypothetical protein IQ06DRAFT_22029 [Stagonospora sp. SRC1lsM3a]
MPICGKHDVLAGQGYIFERRDRFVSQVGSSTHSHRLILLHQLYTQSTFFMLQLLRLLLFESPEIFYCLISAVFFTLLRRCSTRCISH